MGWRMRTMAKASKLAKVESHNVSNFRDGL
jgi:hypothetical protein